MNPMRTSELISILQGFLEKYGDLNVTFDGEHSRYNLFKDNPPFVEDNEVVLHG